MIYVEEPMDGIAPMEATSEGDDIDAFEDLDAEVEQEAAEFADELSTTTPIADESGITSGTAAEDDESDKNIT